MSKRKLLIIISILLILLLIFAIIKIVSTGTEEAGVDDVGYELPDEEEKVNTTMYKLQKLETISDYYTLKQVVGKYYLYYSNVFSDDTSSYNEAIYNMLASDFIEENDVTVDNIKEKLEAKTNFSVEIYNSFYTTNYYNSTYYLVSGLLRDDTTHESEEFQIMLSIDSANGTFEIYPEEYLKNTLNIDVNTLSVGDEISLDYDSSVENREDNIYSSASVTYADYVKAMFDRVRILMLYDTDIAYEMLDKTYGSIFSEKEQMESYLEENRSTIYLLTYGSYELAYENDQMIINIYDKNSRYCISIYTTSIMEFTYSFNTI